MDLGEVLTNVLATPTNTAKNKYYFVNIKTGEYQLNFPNSLDPLPNGWETKKVSAVIFIM